MLASHSSGEGYTIIIVPHKDKPFGRHIHRAVRQTNAKDLHKHFADQKNNTRYRYCLALLKSQ